MSVLMKHSAESVASSDIKAGDLVRNHERHGQWLERAGVRDALMRPVPVVELLELPQGVQQWDWFQISVRSRSSRWQVCTHRSMIEFILPRQTGTDLQKRNPGCYFSNCRAMTMRWI